MTELSFKVGKCPTNEHAKMNRVYCAEGAVPATTKHVIVRNSARRAFAFTIAPTKEVEPGVLAFNVPQRKWAELSLNEVLGVSPLTEAPSYAGQVILEIDFWKKGMTSKTPFNTDKMAAQFLDCFNNTILTRGQPLAFEFETESDAGKVTFDVNVVKMVQANMTAAFQVPPKNKAKPMEGPEAETALIMSQTIIVFNPKEGAMVQLSGSNRAFAARKSIIDPDFDFEQMGVGGLGKEFNTMFRRAFASRIMPLEFVEKLGIKHVKGILLYGPPGTGKTLMARQIGKMLQGREPKIVNGPEILNKFVGESEANVRKLFEDAEIEYKQKGESSSLHIIIFDEIDAICKSRGTVQSGTGVADSVVNQLLTKIDGVESINNVLLIGMTNRPDLIDEALMRPGRLELKIQIGLPDEDGRKEIFSIHTKKMRDNNLLGDDVDLKELAHMSKNFSGAEIAGLVRSAISFATNRCVKTHGKVTVDEEAMDNLKVVREDFLGAFEEVKPAFGVSTSEFDGCVLNGIVPWGDTVERIVNDGRLLVQQVKNSSRTPLVSVLLEGPRGAGKTALAATLAISSEFPLVKLISPETMVGFSELAKVSRINQVFEDAYKSVLSVVVVDDIERLLDYVPIGQRFSNAVLQTLLVLLKKRPPQGHKLLIIGTTTNKEVLGLMDVADSFSTSLHVSTLTEGAEVLKVVEDIKGFTEDEMAFLRKALSTGSKISNGLDEAFINIGVKKLYMLVEMARQETDGRAEKFLNSLLEECRYARSL